MQDQKIFTILQECTVSLTSPTGNGTGFFVAPGGWILTCDHVVADHTSVCLECITEGIKKTFTATVRLKLSDPIDIALLKIEGEAPAHKCVLLDHSLPLPGDRISIFGYPFSFGSMIYAEGDTVRTEYEGESFRNRIKILKLKAGQIQDGLSGSPLFNERTKKVCGILSTSRNTETDLGGRATPINLLFQSQYFQESSNDWNLLASILRENSNYHQKIDKTWSQFISRTYLDRKTALVVAAISVIVAIVVLAISPSNQIVMGVWRLIIASGFGYSVYLFIQSLNLDSVKLRRLPVSSLAGFTITFTFFSISLIAVPDRSVVLRNLTGINEYPVFGLIEQNMPTTLQDTLGIRQEPIVDTHSPVYEAILAFRDESGNTSLMSKYEGKEQEITGTPIVSSEFNENNSTVRSRIVKPLRGQKTYKRERISQTSNDFETALTTFKGEGQEFYYTAGLMPIQSTLENAKYTAFLPVSQHERPYEMLQPGSLLQYPKLSDVRSTLRFQFGSSWLNNEWFKNILEQNPNVRGFLGFEYKYLIDPSSDPSRNVLGYLFGCGFTGINRIAPSPYVRFLDIANKSLSSVKINTVSFQTIRK
ncbi:MAG: serine protease [Cyanobacteriota bacterium]